MHLAAMNYTFACMHGCDAITKYSYSAFSYLLYFLCLDSWRGGYKNAKYIKHLAAVEKVGGDFIPLVWNLLGPFALSIIRSIADCTTTIGGEGDWENLTFVGCLILDKPIQDAITPDIGLCKVWVISFHFPRSYSCMYLLIIIYNCSLKIG